MEVVTSKPGDRTAQAESSPANPDYETLSLAGRGAYGCVWVARDRSGVLRALKVIELARLPDHEAGDREEQALSLVRQRIARHPHLVEVFHVSHDDRRLVYAMELADAAPGSPPPGHEGYQADTLARRIAVNGRLSGREAVHVTLDLLSALEALHTAKIVHRDIKPANVIFVGGIPKLADIGLATVVQTGLSVAGTPGYLPLDGSTGPDADLYALGKLLYQAATGLAPSNFPTVPVEVLKGPDSELMRRLNRVLLRACAATKAERFGSAAELRTALEDVLAPRPRTLPKLLLAGACLALLLAGVFGFWAANRNGLPQDPEPVPPLTAPPAATPIVPPPSVAEVLAALTDEPVDDAFLRAVAALPARDQVRVVAAKMQRLNPGFDGRLVPIIHENKVTELSFAPYQVTDLSPVRALTDLVRLDCGSNVAQRYGQITDLAPLRGLRLTKLRCAWNRVTDLAPLQDMPLEWLDFAGNAVRDLAPLRGLPLRELFCHTNQIRDLTPLADLPLTSLNCGFNPVEDWSPLRGMPLRALSLFDTSVADLSVVEHMPLEQLFCQRTQITDLGPLRGKPLKYLNCGGNAITSLEPLRGSPLESLWVWDTQVESLEPLRGKALRELSLTGTKVTDLRPLQDMPLRRIYLDVRPGLDLEPLRALKALAQINGQRASDFWAKQPKGSGRK